MTLATAFADGRVSARTVLLKGFNESGFVFFTNYKSKKGNQVSSNPHAALLFYWPETGRQIRIEGRTERISEKDSELYFNTRPRESQLSAWASQQSSVIPTDSILMIIISILKINLMKSLFQNLFTGVVSGFFPNGLNSGRMDYSDYMTG